ncbi:PilN family type IVB pilus formation outer membrane protein [Polaromonas sp. JS666]|uniref:PilN family type IVB pilus formation outer membrane protein n=1 Tax=Polaromonas sp. (strain JS666 / ATCC BAA-500) TaxID=296591 RepID=UPI0000D5B4B1|nr:PilN family type IVB pilus formation outer membrane protein [Polaromonas sp. JS666]ABE47305.1 type II and III secretion system protein [Polaromonas sp. JS666]
MKFALSIMSVAAAALTAGCVTTPGSNETIRPKVEVSRERAEKLLASRPVAESGPVSFSEQSWIPLRKVERSERDKANAKTDAIQVEINQRFNSLNDVAGLVASMTGLPVAVDPDVSTRPQQAGTTPAAVAPLPMGGAAGGPLPFPMGAAQGYSPSGTPSGPVSAASPLATNYSGNLAGFMNFVSAYYGISWRVEGNGLRFFLMESRTFRIAALPGDTRLSSAVESTSSSGGSSSASGGAGLAGPTQSGSSTNSTGVGFAGLSVWTALESGIKQMLSNAGKVSASPATGTITVTDTPAVMEKVADFVTAQNQALNRLVSVNVRVLSVEISEGDDYGINWDAVYANLSAANPYSLALKTAFPTATGAGNLIISAPAGSNSRWAGSSAMLSALSMQGRVSELTSATLVTLNNQPAPVNVGRKVSYLASSSQTQTANVGSTVSLTPGVIQTGFSMTIVPHIIDGNELLLQYSLDLSSLLKLNTISSGTSSIQAPDVATSNFIQRVRLKSGETLVVAGFDQDNLTAVANGVGAAENKLLGSRTGSTKRQILVVLIQPNIAH